MSPEKRYQTPSQTVGPDFAYGLTPEQYRYDFPSMADGNLITNEQVNGERITLAGQVWDGNGNLIPDAMIEIWQADADGQYAKDPRHFRGFGRFGTGTLKEAKFEFRTIKPGSVEGQAPHVNVILFMRGLLVHAYTRLYFSDEGEANAHDPVLQRVEEERRSTLIASRTTRPDGTTCYTFPIYLQRSKETVFFDV
ncbi:protocatechuate 3,4-dioxygenase subunit alpha [soil metagenome]